MKKLFLILVIIFSFGLSEENTFAGFFDTEYPTVEYDCGGSCTLQKGVELLKGIAGMEQDRPFSQYVQAVVIYLMTFISLIAVIYIIYAGFRILTGAGEDEQLKKSKNIIIYVALGMTLMWLAFAIVKFILAVLGI